MLEDLAREITWQEAVDLMKRCDKRVKEELQNTCPCSALNLYCYIS